LSSKVIIIVFVVGKDGGSKKQKQKFCIILDYLWEKSVRKHTKGKRSTKGKTAIVQFGSLNFG